MGKSSAVFFVCFLLHAALAFASPEGRTATRVSLPEGLSDEAGLKHYLEIKFFGISPACTAVGEKLWLCEIPCGDNCRLSIVSDLKTHRALHLPETDLPFFRLASAPALVGMAFMPSRTGWNWSALYLDLEELSFEEIPIFSGPYQNATRFELKDQGKSRGFTLTYCLETSGCFEDRFDRRRKATPLKSHERLSEPKPGGID